ncbi:MAG: ATP-binding protein [Heliobacteriaceae bacterium]|nr:ATP-binding protein [Heliobacteriaceae bacterium]
MNKVKKISAGQLMRRRLDPAQMAAFCYPQDFDSTRQMSPAAEGIVGQTRAVKAMEFGLAAKYSGFHIFISGPVNTGKTSFALNKVNQVAGSGQTPADICFVYNFNQPDRPLVLVLPAGLGSEFRRDVKELIEDFQIELPKAFEGEVFEKKRAAFLRQVENKLTEMFKEMENSASRYGFRLQKGPNGVFTLPLNSAGEPYSKEEFEVLDEEYRAAISEKEQQLEGLMAEVFRRSRQLQKEAKQHLKEMEQETAVAATSHLVDVLREKYKQYSKVAAYLEGIQVDVTENLNDFRGAGASDGEENLPATVVAVTRLQKSTVLTRYEVNVFVDNATSVGAPVVMEANPTFYNLFGKVEYRSSFGSLVTDFTMLKPGAVHQANGGYLILHALPLLTSPGAWEGLKRMLKTGEVRIENLGEQLGLTAFAAVQPEPIPVAVKVILIGNPRIYHLLYSLDEDFRKLFKVRVDFDYVVERSPENIRQYAAFIGSVCRKEDLLPLTAGGVGRVIDFSSRLAGHQKKLSTCLGLIKDIVVEAGFWAARENAPLVDISHVDLAIKEKQYRSNLLEHRLQEAMAEGLVLLDVAGAVVGQVNGLAVIDLGDYAFGKPTRVTARVYLGREGIVNIEREIQMSGQTHTKGVLILAAFFSARFAQDKPLAFAATLTFEQVYDGIDGDSASATELYALVSAIAGIPLNQGIAVTGSVNQNGEVQPIGGINEKIEGFFRVCHAQGLTGDQGVIFPARNIPNLMLNQEVIEAAQAGLFHLYPVNHVDEGIEILTGIVAGKPGEDGSFPAGTFNFMVTQKLQEMNEKWKMAARDIPHLQRKRREKAEKR